MSEQWPSVSVVLPVKDDAAHLEAAVLAVLAQEYPGPLDVVIGVGPSSDGTEEVAARLAADPRVLAVPNPSGGTAAGLNAAIAAASGEVLVRVDGHAELSDGYVRRAVETLQRTGAANVGGIQRAVGTTPMQRAIAAAMTSRFGVGDARFHYGGEEGPTDTVYLGVFRRTVLEELGGYDESLVRNQDYELNWRIREAGGVVWFDPALSVTYHPRPTLRRLADQYHQYGRWKRVVVRRAPGSLRWRQLVPPAALLANLGGTLVGIALWRPALTVPGVYALAAVLASARAEGTWATRARLPLVFAAMHHAWGAGFLRGMPDPGRQTAADLRPPDPR